MHAGIYIEEKDVSILIDPWFFDSTLSFPIVEGLSGLQTIDFQIPKAKEKIGNYHPDAILVSHFHPHHAPAKDICQLIQQTKSTLLAHPPIPLSQKSGLELTTSPHLTIRSVHNNDTFKVEPFLITALEHTVPHHIAWSAESMSGHL